MAVDQRDAVFDADFLNHICDTELNIDRVNGILSALLEKIDKRGIVHPLVHQEEFQIPNECRQSLFDRGTISIPNFDDIFQQDETRKNYYCLVLVPELYKQLNGKQLPENWDVLTNWMAGQNLGEIHSIAMCLICGCTLFLSDDHGSQRAIQALAENQMPNAINIEVYNRSQFLEEVGVDAGISRKERRALAHKRN